MRQNRHILNRNNSSNSYQHANTFKIRQPLNQESYNNRQNYYKQQKIENINNNRQYRQSSVSSFYQKHPNRNLKSIQSRQNSRQMSYNSKGSNATKNSIKINDFVVRQAKNLIENKDKYKYEVSASKDVKYKLYDNVNNPNHIRSTSMHVYPSTYKVSRSAVNQRSLNYLNQNDESHSTYNNNGEIPSFGIECRSTISGGYKDYQMQKQKQKSASLNKYTLNSFKIQDPSQYSRYPTTNKTRVKTQIDERIQKLRVSSVSSNHRERMNHIKAIDNNRIQNMDKINIKIKNILTTLEQEENYYKEKFEKQEDFPGRGFEERSSKRNSQKRYSRDNRVYTQGSYNQIYNNYSHVVPSKRKQYEWEARSRNEKYSKPIDEHKKSVEQYSDSHNATFLNNEQSFSNYQNLSAYSNQNHNNSKNYYQKDASSYYYFEEQSAMLKSSQSPIMDSPQKMFNKKHSIQKYDKEYEYKRIKRPSCDKNTLAYSYQKNLKTDKAYYNQNPIKINISKKQQKRQSSKLLNSIKLQQFKVNSNYLKNLPEFQTQKIVQSKTTQQTTQQIPQKKHEKSFNFLQLENRFDSIHNEKKDLIKNFNKNYNHIFQKGSPSQDLDYQNYRTPQLLSRQFTSNQFHQQQKNTFENSFKSNNSYYTNNMSFNPISKNRESKTLIYFKRQQQQKYLQTKRFSNQKSVQNERRDSLNVNKKAMTLGSKDVSWLKDLKEHSPENNLSSYNYTKSSFNNCFNNGKVQNEIFRPESNKIQSLQKKIQLKTLNDVTNVAKNKKKQDYYFSYTDSIKQTPRIKDQPKQKSPKISPSQLKSKQLIDSKLKQYQKRIQKYKKEMQKQDVISLNSKSISKSKSRSSINDISPRKSSSSNRYGYGIESQLKHFNNSINSKNQYKTFNNTGSVDMDVRDSQRSVSKLSQNNVQRLIEQMKNQRLKKQQQNKSIKNKDQLSERINNTNSGELKIKECPTYNNAKTAQNFNPMKNYSPRQPRHFNFRDSNPNLIEDLKRQRQQALSRRKHTQTEKKHLQRQKSSINSASVDYSRLRNEQKRSDSQTSRISAITLVKGKNIDDEILKIQQKMNNYQKLKKQLNLQSQQNTQRSIVKQNNQEVKKVSPSLVDQKPKNNQARRQFSVQIKQSKSSQRSQNPKSAIQLIKMLTTQQNTYVKIRKSIVRQNKNNQIKNYLNSQIVKQKSLERKQNSSIVKNQIKQSSNNSTKSKQNILPPTTTTIESPKFTNGIKKVPLGLAQNLILNCMQHSQNSTSRINESNDVSTPKLLKNLKNKNNQISRIKKKTQKRGFRSKFINNLHQDNQIIYSAKKQISSTSIQQQQQQIITSTQRYLPENRILLNNFLTLLEKQIQLDQQLRNQKKWFNSLVIKDKWSMLMNEYIKTVPSDNSNNSKHKMLLSQIVKMFTLEEQQNNPFHSTRGSSSNFNTLIEASFVAEQFWIELVKQMSSSMSLQSLTACGLNEKSLDIERKGSVQIQDLTRFINMELNKYYRNRDLWLIWKRLIENSKQKGQISNSQNEKSSNTLKFETIIAGLGIKH